MNPFELLRKEDGTPLYAYLRGSHCHGTATELSDTDIGGVFMAPIDNVLGLGLNYQGQIANETNDIVFYELKKYMELLIKSNPTVLESLFVDDEFVMYEHSAMKMIKSYRNEFLTKKCFNSFFNYAESQIKKAKGLNKKINWDIVERKTPFDFAYTFYKQGSTKIKDWLDNRGLNKNYCGLVHIPNMHDTYGVYYDWGAHFEAEGIKSPKEFREKNPKAYEFAHIFYGFDIPPCQDGGESEYCWFEDHKNVIHYRGMCLENATDMRGSSVSKGEKPLCHIVYNESGFQAHCKKYKEFKDWEVHRNPIRYESNLKKSYDAKNMSECFRLMQCGIEIARGEGYIVNRKGIDADFLLDIKNHKFEYEELIERLNFLKDTMKKAMEESALKEDIDPFFVDALYLKLRKP